MKGKLLVLLFTCLWVVHTHQPLFGQCTPPAPTLNAENNVTSSCGKASFKLYAKNEAPTANLTHRWYSQASGGTFFTGTVFNAANPLVTLYTTPQLESTATYYVSTYNTSTLCESSRTALTLTIIPAIDLTISKRPVCNNGAALLAATGAPAGSTYSWKDANGQVVGTASSYTTPVLTANATYTLTVDAAGYCQAVRTVTAEVYAAYPLPTASGGAVCPNQPATLTASVDTEALPAASTLQWYWYDAATGGNAVFTSNTSNTFTTPALGSTTRYWVAYQLTSSPYCMSGRVAVDAQVATPAAPTATGATGCPNTPIALTASGAPAGGVYRWYNAANTLLYTGATFTTPVLSATTTYYVAVFRNCESPKTAVTATVGAVGIPTATKTNYTFGDDDVFEITASPGTNGNICRWYTAAGGTAFVQGNKYAPVMGCALTKTFYVATYNTNSTCESSQRLAITVNVGPTFCANYVRKNQVIKPGVTTLAQVAALTSAERQMSMTYFDGLGNAVQSVAWQNSPTKKDVIQPVVYDAFGREPLKYLPYTGGGNAYYQDQAVTSPTAGQVFAFYKSDNQAALDDKRAVTSQPYAESDFEASPLNRVVEQGAAGALWAVVRDATTKVSDRSGKTVKTFWRAGKQTLTTTAGTAASGDDNVHEFAYDPANGNVSTNQFYDARRLSVTVLTDEHDYQTVEYKNKLGQVVLKRVQVQGPGQTDFTRSPAPGDCASTYYAYDDAGQLRLVIQPEGAALLPATLSRTAPHVIDPAFAKRWCFAYRYDGKGRLTEKRVPGAGPVTMIYGRRDELLLSQDARQKVNNQWNFIKYDGLGRVVMTGLYTPPAGVTVSQANADAFSGTFFESRSSGAPPAAQHGYTLGQSYPQVTGGTHTVLTVNYYDDYDFDDNNADPLARDRDYATAGLTPEPVPFYRVMGKPTASRVLHLGNNTWLWTVTFYDRYGRVIQTQTDNPLAGRETVTHVLNFAGWVEQKKSTHTSTVNAVATTLNVHEEYDYDEAGRLLLHHHRINDGPRQLLKSLAYNELGQVVRKNLHLLADPLSTTENALPATRTVSTTQPATAATEALATREIDLGDGFLAEPTTGEFTARITSEMQDPTGRYLQNVDYKYNIRGWLSQINDAALTETKDLFGLELLYTGGNDLGNVALAADKLQYNGNIAAQKWNSRGAHAPVARMYTYGYDPANRLTSALYADQEPAAGKRYSVTGISYSRNGNLLTLTQEGLHSLNSSTGQGVFKVVDRLQYGYSQGNRLSQVSELNTGATTDNLTSKGLAGDFLDKATNAAEYEYDEVPSGTATDYGNGNLVSDDNKGITAIGYNHLNLPERIEFGTDGKNYLRYVYSAAGVKLRKEVWQEGSLESWQDYAGGVVYEKDRLQFVATEEGRALHPAFVGQGSGSQYVYEYHYKDHLGNLRLSFREPEAKVVLLATMELQNGQREESQFENIATTRRAGPASSGTYAAKLDGANVLGPLKTLRLKQGDQVQARVQVYYQSKTATSNVSLLAYLGGVRVASGSEGQRNVSLLQVGVGIAPAPVALQGQPKAYLRCIFYDEHYQYVRSWTELAPASGKGAWQTLALPGFTAQEAGYLQVFVANESNGQAEVWFDELEITYQQAMSVQENHYSPWGLNLVGIEQQGSPDHKFQYIGREKQEEFGLNWLDLQARMYDPQLGRFHAVDPLVELYQESWTPYHYSFNNPIRFSDPDGRWPDLGDVGDFLAGVGNAFASNATTVQGPTQTYSAVERGSGGKAYTIGQAVGDGLSLIEGSAQAVLGATVAAGGAVGGVVLSPTGVGAIAGAGVSAVGVAASGHGLNTAMNAANNLLGGNKGRVYSNSSNNNPSQPSKPTEAYNRRKHYGTTPTKSQRTQAGAQSNEVLDHDPPLVQRYYEGDPRTGEIPGYQMTPAERKASASDMSRMSRQNRSESDAQGATMATYSKRKKKENGL